ncbi:MAG: restriction endonuclease subunit S [Bifidobacterium longum]
MNLAISEDAKHRNEKLVISGNCHCPPSFRYSRLSMIRQTSRKYASAWEQRKLGELSSEFQSGDFISAEEILGSGPYPVYGGNGLRGYAKQYNHDGFYALIGRQGALCGNVNTAVGKAYFTEHAVAVKANFLHDTRFLAHLLGCMDLGRYSGQSAQPGLAVGVLKEVETTVPSKAEQQAIGSFFSRLDSLITLHQRKRLSIRQRSPVWS